MTNREKPKSGEEVVKPEGFAGRNAKVITFIVCMVIFFAFFGPISFFRIADCAEQRQVQSAPELTEEIIAELCQSKSGFTMKQLRTYRGTYNTGDKGNTFTAEFGHYMLLAFEDSTTMTLTYCTVTNLQTEEQLDMMNENANPTAFFGRN